MRQVLALTPADDESRAGARRQPRRLDLQAGRARERARRTIARRPTTSCAIKQAAPTSKIRAAAEYDAGAALIRLQDWNAAADGARRVPHDVSRARAEARGDQADRVRLSRERRSCRAPPASTSASPRSRQIPSCAREALLVAGELYEQSTSPDRALAVYSRYVEQFPKPVETAVETRFKIAEIYKATQRRRRSYHEQLAADRRSRCRGGRRADGRARATSRRARRSCSRSSSTSSFAAVKLVQPFEQSLQEKQRRMDAAIEAFGDLVDYEVGEVTAAATFYMAEIYSRLQPRAARIRAPGRPAAARSCRSTSTRSRKRRSRSRRRRSRSTRRTWS